MLETGLRRCEWDTADPLYRHDHEIVAHFDEADVARLLGDAGIVRSRATIERADG